MQVSIFLSIKSDTVIPLLFDFGLITLVPFSAQRVGWSWFAWNVLSSWMMTTVLSVSSCGGALSSVFLALSVGAQASLRNPSATICRKKVLRYSTTSSLWCPLMNVPFFFFNIEPSSSIHFRAVSTVIFVGNPGSRVSFGSSSSAIHPLTVPFTHWQNLPVVTFGWPLYTCICSYVYTVLPLCWGLHLTRALQIIGTFLFRFPGFLHQSRVAHTLSYLIFQPSFQQAQLL